MSNSFTLPNGTVIHRPSFTTMDAPPSGDHYQPGYVSVRGGLGFNPGEQYTSTDYADCYLDIGKYEAATASTNKWAQLAFDLRSEELFDLMVQATERYLRSVPANYGVRSGYPTEPRHNRAHANKLARHAKRPNGRPRHR